MSAGGSAAPAGRTFRLPRLAYLGVACLALCVLPLALVDNLASDGSGTALGPRAVLLAIPLVAIVFIARTATVVDGTGVHVRALFGRRELSWDDVRGIAVEGRSVYAVVEGGSVRLPCVHVADLAAMSAASDGRLPALDAPTPKYAPSRRRR